MQPTTHRPNRARSIDDDKPRDQLIPSIDSPRLRRIHLPNPTRKQTREPDIISRNVVQVRSQRKCHGNIPDTNRNPGPSTPTSAAISPWNGIAVQCHPLRMDSKLGGGIEGGCSRLGPRGKGDAGQNHQTPACTRTALLTVPPAGPPVFGARSGHLLRLLPPAVHQRRAEGGRGAARV